ncbi:MAG: hypothetical protein HYU66_26095 [Armatimonadetes bacterium]|nr:hypothetical protein [Armatimonadota bacterium]
MALVCGTAMLGLAACGSYSGAVGAPAGGVLAADRASGPGAEITPTCVPLPALGSPAPGVWLSGFVLTAADLAAEDGATDLSGPGMGWRIAANGLRLEYVADGSPLPQTTQVLASLARAADSWNSQVLRPGLITVTLARGHWTPPQLDGRSVVEWAGLRRDDEGAEVVAAAYLFMRGSALMETDIVLNCNASVAWSAAGAPDMGLDPGAVMSAVLGHVLALAGIRPHADVERPRPASIRPAGRKP